MQEKDLSLAFDQSTLFEQLLSSTEQVFGVKGVEVPSFSEWCQTSGIILDGHPFTFVGNEYLREPYEDNHPFTADEKAGQMGLTSLSMLSVIYGARYLGYRGVMYFFPSRTDVTDFSKGRIDPLIDDNPETIGKWLKETDAANIKNIWNCFVYFRGMGSRLGLKSVPADFLVFDELDEAPQKNLNLAMERLSHSKFGRVKMLSNPTLPDYGINKAFQETDQRHWLLKCEKCGDYTCMEDTFPACLAEVRGRVVRLCQKCRDHELNPAIGEWVAKKPSITEKRGRHYSQLFSQSTSYLVDPAYILHHFRTTNDLQTFYNMKIGVPYVEAEHRLAVEMVLALCGSDGIASSDPGPCSMGVDQGKDLHVVIGKSHEAIGGEVVHLGVYKDWEDLDPLMKAFHVARCVVDALPETRNARTFAKRFPGKVFLNFYNDNQKGSYAWDEGKLIVQCNRTESLDASHHQLLHGLIVLPRENPLVQEFAKHCHNTAKKLEEDEKSGSKRYVYVKLGPDHFRHAFNYERMAAEVMRPSGAISHVSLGMTTGPLQIEGPKKPKVEVPEEYKWVKNYD